jgi:low affinity Fe/Cu permease
VQIKLDELLRALPQADDHFVHIEVGSDDELQELETRKTADHAAVREDDPSPEDL